MLTGRGAARKWESIRKPSAGRGTSPAGMCSGVHGSCVKIYLKGTCGPTVMHGGCKSPFDFTGETSSKASSARPSAARVLS